MDTLRQSQLIMAENINCQIRPCGKTQLHQNSSADFLNACNDVGAKWEKYIAAEYGVAAFDNQKV